MHLFCDVAIYQYWKRSFFMNYEGSVLLASHALLSDVWKVLWLDKRF